MTRDAPYQAVITDMDGVITRTASIHERAWKRTFDDFLEHRSRETHETYLPFSREDYQRFVDGKPRYVGVRDFLSARGIGLPEGGPADEPGEHSVHGLGLRKNALYLELIEAEGVAVFDDSVRAIERWRRGGLRVAVISASRNCRQVLEAAGLLDRFDAIVDGQTAEELAIDGKAAVMTEAAGRLDAAPADAVLLEDATAGVRAACDAGFGLVVGIDRDGHARALARAGAHQTVGDLGELRFLRRVPSALSSLDAVRRARADRTLAVFLDYDGTLSPIVDDPARARMSEGMRTSVRALSRRFKVAIVSGRERRDVEERVAIDGLFYAGSHGFDIRGPTAKVTRPEAEHAVGLVRRASTQLRERLAGIEGVNIEHKRFSVATHYRNVDPAEVDAVQKTVDDVLMGSPGLRKLEGKKVIELQPDIEWDKGHAVRWIKDVLDVADDDTLAIYIGDDETDEDAFFALRGVGLGVRVGSEITTSLADLTLEDPDAVQQFLQWLSEIDDDR